MVIALKDLEILRRSNAEALQKHGQALRNRLVGTLALKESRKLIQQSISTKRINSRMSSYPLSLSTSGFGMNFIEVQNSQLWVFFGTAGIALAMSLFLWLSLDWLSKPVVTDNLIDIGKAIIILTKLFWQAPSHAVILIIFALCYSTMHTRLILIQNGLWDIICSEIAPRPIGISLISIIGIGQKNSRLKCRYARVAQVEDFAKSSQWRQRYLSRRKDVQINRDV